MKRRRKKELRTKLISILVAIALILIVGIIAFGAKIKKAIDEGEEINGRWFYKAKGVKFIDFMPAFFGKKAKGNNLTLKIFAPPATGENDSSQGDDWRINYYYTLTKLPKIRLEYKAVM